MGAGKHLVCDWDRNKELQDLDKAHGMVTNDWNLVLKPPLKRYSGAETCSSRYLPMGQKDLPGTMPIVSPKAVLQQENLGDPHLWFYLWKTIHWSTRATTTALVAGAGSWAVRQRNLSRSPTLQSSIFASLPVNLFPDFLDGFSCDLLFLDSTALSVGNPSPSLVPTGTAEKQPFPCKLIIGQSCCLLYSFLRQWDTWPQGSLVQSVSFRRLIRVRGREIRGSTWLCRPRSSPVEPVATGPCYCFPGPLARNTCDLKISAYATLLTPYSLYMLPSTQTLLSQPLERSKLGEPEKTVDVV